MRYMKKLFIAIIGIALVAGASYWYMQMGKNTTTVENQPSTSTTTQATSTASVSQPKEIIGKSVEGRDIVAYNFGSGSKRLLFVGGIHGGYEWNTALVAYQLIDYLTANPSAIPANQTITVIPVVNPDGLYKVVGTTTKFTAANVTASKDTQVAGRFNANTVDLNRNFDCDWQANGVWQSKKVSGGSAAFSEPESLAIKEYVTKNTPTAVLVWYSSAGGVYASNCHGGVLAETSAITKKFAEASGYPAHESWDFYATTGDMANWLAKINIPSFSVLLTNHTDTEWTKNLAGVTALLQHYAQ
jgi:hypothetical protein